MTLYQATPSGLLSLINDEARRDIYPRHIPEICTRDICPRYIPEICPRSKPMRDAPAQVRMPKPSDSSLLLKMECANKSGGKIIVDGVWRKMARSQVVLLCISRVYLGYISGVSRVYLGHISGISRVYLGYISGISRAHLGCISGISLRARVSSSTTSRARSRTTWTDLSIRTVTRCPASSRCSYRARRCVSYLLLRCSLKKLLGLTEARRHP